MLPDKSKLQNNMYGMSKVHKAKMYCVYMHIHNTCTYIYTCFKNWKDICQIHNNIFLFREVEMELEHM